jgi:hypothetical protein
MYPQPNREAVKVPFLISVKINQRCPKAQRENGDTLFDSHGWLRRTLLLSFALQNLILKIRTDADFK